ncbi:MAG: DUF4167 domain-containing protein [Pseudomonadota bacterium]
MRSSSKNRSRSKNGRKSLGNIVNRVFESAGPEGKVRGTPQQIIEKYTTLSRDAQTAGDRIAAENFQQHAEHYIRLLADAQREMAPRTDPAAVPVVQPVADVDGEAVPVTVAVPQPAVVTPDIVADAMATIDSADEMVDGLGLVETPEGAPEVERAEPVAVEETAKEAEKATKPKARAPRRRPARSKEAASPATQDEVSAS